jgi:hypothetical protein
MGNKIPASWFDDPEWEVLRRRAEKRPIPKSLKQQVKPQARPRSSRQEPRTRVKLEDTDKEVVLNLKIAVPKFKLPNARQFYARHRAGVFKATGAALGLVVTLLALKLISGRQTASQGVAQKPTSAKEQAKAAFNPLVPLDNLADATGKQAQPEFRYDAEKKVLGYATEYNDTHLTISQQAVPEKFKSNPAELMSVASSIKAETRLETQKGTAFLAKDPKSGAQTAVFATKEVLVFIRSDKELDGDEWQFYINQLNPSK